MNPDLDLSEIQVISKNQLQKVAIVGTHLHQWQGIGKEGILKTFKSHGFVQLDPLNPAGRNHDFFFFARVPDYNQGQFEQILYSKNMVFESHFHLLNAIHQDHFSMFYCRKEEKFLGNYYQKRLIEIKKKDPELLNNIVTHIDKNGPIGSQDLPKFGKLAQGEKWTKNSGASALEILWATGKITVVERDQQFRKKYDLISKRYSSSQLERRNISDQELWWERLYLHIRSFAVTDSRIGISKSGILTFSKAKDAWTKRIGNQIIKMSKSENIQSDNDYSPTLVFCKEVNRLYIVPQKWKELLQENYDDEVRLIAPLDPLIWDRKFLKEIFNFDYVWEIYKPIKDRKWGYYVLPILYKGKFIGRVEANMKIKDRILRIISLRSENKSFSTIINKKLENLFLNWKRMCQASVIKKELN